MVKEIKSLAETRFVSMYELFYDNKLGQRKSWILSSRKPKSVLEKQFFEKQDDKADAVVIVAFHKLTKSIVCLKQFRVPINSYIYELPAGLIDAGEDINSTVERELKEETGLALVDMLDGHDKLYLSPGMTDESVALMYCTCEGELSTKYLEADEDITPYLLTKEEAQTILKSDNKIDIKLYVVLSAFVNGQYDENL
ncbi:MAG: DNA mismatch repair protein MutT [Epulopiscium sp. Nele67-Bin001]|nr:MAG: DNA mismatch repair protein MutT [Epulopiscium sp. Nele67-Bin001]